MSAPDGNGERMHVVATAGHVDHGKSALVRALTGIEPDRLAEERRRGLTIDLGFASTWLPAAGTVAFVDVPGHARFIGTMLAGVAVVEAALLCVDAREGWRAQTEEHLRILEVVGVPAGLVAITKAALVDDERIAAVADDVARRTAGTVLDGAPVVACDALDGRGLDRLCLHLDAILAARPPSLDRGRPRLWVDRSFTLAGAGTVVTGGVGHGRLASGEKVEVRGARGALAARLRGIQALGRVVDEAAPGTRAALNLAGVEHGAVHRGDAVVRPGEWQVTDTVDATLTVLAGLDHHVTRRGAYLAYVGTGERAVRLHLLDGPRVAPGGTGRVRIALDRALPLVPGDRYVLRETGRSETVGGGEVLDVAPGRADAGGDRLGAEAVSDCVELTAVLEASRPVGLDVTRLDDRQRAALARLVDDGTATTVAGYAVAPAWRDELARHPAVRALEERPFAPPPIDPDLDPEVRRALVRRGIVIAKDGVHFAATARPAAVRVLAGLAGGNGGPVPGAVVPGAVVPGTDVPGADVPGTAVPGTDDLSAGFTVSQAREALGTTRRWALPLLGLLDDAGLTIRDGDRRRLRSEGSITER
ncbi:MAG TPA: SelB C-terminal domain-containing protein [Acidimicrobiales bacterium]|nr:SelB C-terminal domain-containing protein [Acidimicrobiales bacterium]